VIVLVCPDFIIFRKEAGDMVSKKAVTLSMPGSHRVIASDPPKESVRPRDIGQSALLIWTAKTTWGEE
jgi:hypothetical protein